jgi:hypothetical protein
MDDCLVHPQTLEQHLLDTAEVLETFHRHQLYAKSYNKREFGRQERPPPLQGGGVGQPEQGAVDCRVLDADVVHGSAALHGPVEGYAEIVAPLTALGGPAARFVWSPDAQASFDTLKRALSSAPVLRTFDPSRQAVLRRPRAALRLRRS